MSVRDTIQELTEVCIGIRQKLESSLDKKEKEGLVQAHIKAFSEKASRIADFQPGSGAYELAFMSRNETPKKSKDQNASNFSRVTLASSNESASLKNEQDRLLTDEEIHEYVELIECEKVLDQELLSLRIRETEFRSTGETMDLLHKYNDIRDATQRVIEAIAVADRTLARDLYEKYGLPWDKD